MCCTKLKIVYKFSVAPFCAIVFWLYSSGNQFVGGAQATSELTKCVMNRWVSAGQGGNVIEDSARRVLSQKSP